MSKIPFSIEYRPLIESGEYKAEIGREDPWPARIVCWDLNGDNIIAVVMNPEGREEGLIYTKQGKHNAICPRIDSDLFIIIPEPELTESEDERIRKEIISALKFANDGGVYDKHIAYLEKQKERGPLTKEEEFTLQRIIEHLEDNDCPAEWKDLLHDIYILPYEKQKEQKPVQFKNNDLVDIIKGEFEGFRTLLKKAGVDYEPQRSYWEGFARLFDSSAREYVREQKSAEYLDKDKVYAIMTKLTNLSYSQLIPINSNEFKKLHEITSEVRSLLDYPIEQKPAEWSEEEYGRLFDIEHYLDGTLQLSPDRKIACIDFLKSLRPQPRKEIYLGAKHDLAIKFMNYLDENRPEGKMSLSNGECEDIDKAFKENDWAKIMRYVEKYSSHWKPSEEQVRALERAIVRFNSVDDIPILTELRDKLKKL